jgi:hypothetical protein
MGQKSGPQLPMNSDAQRSKPGFGTVVRFRRVVIEHDKGGGFNRSTQHLLAVYLQESGNPMSFWDVDSSVAILGRACGRCNLLLLRHVTPLTRHHVVYLMGWSAAFTQPTAGL